MRVEESRCLGTSAISRFRENTDFPKIGTQKPKNLISFISGRFRRDSYNRKSALAV